MKGLLVTKNTGGDAPCLYAEVEGVGIYITHLIDRDAKTRTKEAELLT